MAGKNPFASKGKMSSGSDDKQMRDFKKGSAKGKPAMGGAKAVAGKGKMPAAFKKGGRSK